MNMLLYAGNNGNESKTWSHIHQKFLSKDPFPSVFAPISSLWGIDSLLHLAERGGHLKGAEASGGTQAFPSQGARSHSQGTVCVMPTPSKAPVCITAHWLPFQDLLPPLGGPPTQSKRGMEWIGKPLLIQNQLCPKKLCSQKIFSQHFTSPKFCTCNIGF